MLEYLSTNIRRELEKDMQDDIEEIRLRNNKKLTLKIGRKLKTLDYIVNTQDVLQTFEKICENSVYSYRRQICDGFITIRGGHRVGIVGSAVIENGQVINMNYISSLNFRIARQKIGCSNNIIDELIGHNTLIISPPGCGKTTLLRDIIRNISNRGFTVGVVDERGEIAAMYKGIPQNDVGIRTDVIENIPKSIGMKMLIRSMAPELIACDEIGSKEDIKAINEAILSGVKGIFTMHGKDMEDIKLNTNIKELIDNRKIEKIIFL